LEYLKKNETLENEMRKE